MTTINTFNIPLTDSNKAVTINFIFLLWEINLNGRKILNSLKILTNENDYPLYNRISIILVTTIKKSN